MVRCRKCLYRAGCVAHDAFISYSTHDKAVADAACALLESRGIRCWIAPRDVTPGMDWGSEIIDAINGARVMVLVYSASANESGQIRREVERGVHKGIPIVPFRIEDVPMSKSLEYFISAQHWLDALTPPLEQHLDYLARTVTLLLSRPLMPNEASDDRTETDTPAAPPPLHQPPFASANAAANAAANPAAGTAAYAHGPASPPAFSAPPLSAPPPSAPASSAPAYSAPAAANAAASRRKMGLAGLVVLFLAIAGYAVLGRGKSVDSALVGQWSVTKDDQSGHWVSNLSFTKDGTYHLHVSLLESGTMTGSPGHFHMVSSAQTVTDGTYILVDPTTLETTTQAGTVRWTRQASSVNPNRTSDLFGIWDASPIVNGALVHQEIDSRSDGTYHLSSTTEDAGTVTASKNRWRTASNTGRVLEGTYQVTDPHTLSWVGPLGSTVWTRQ
jgi:TIR domain-containing protein